MFCTILTHAEPHKFISSGRHSASMSERCTLIKWSGKASRTIQLQSLWRRYTIYITLPGTAAERACSNRYDTHFTSYRPYRCRRLDSIAAGRNSTPIILAIFDTAYSVLLENWTIFTARRVCIARICRDKMSVCLFVCHTLVLCLNRYRYPQFFSPF